MPRFFNHKHEVDLVWAENKKRVELELNLLYNRVKNEILEHLRQQFQDSLDNGVILVLDRVDKDVLRQMLINATKKALAEKSDA